MNPQISVVMPVYNCIAYIKESVGSILAQTFIDFELLIIDDHSTDGTYEYLQQLSDPRIVLIRKTQNSGYAKSLNMGLDRAKGKYIARMDGDDIALPERFAKQVAYMDNDPEVLVCGSSYQIVGTDTIVQLPLTYEAAKVVSIMNVPVAHPTAFIRQSVLIQHQLRYNEQLEPTEDYDLWTRILEIGKIENLPEVLLLYRKHSEQESITKYNRLLTAAVEIRERQLKKLLTFEKKNYSVLFAIDVLTKQALVIDTGSIKKIVQLLTDMHKNNLIKKMYDDSLLCNFLREIWLFYIPQFNDPRLQDIKLLSQFRESEITRMGLIFDLKLLKKMVVSFKSVITAANKNSL